MIVSIDHVVITSVDIKRTIYFYCDILNMSLRKEKDKHNNFIKYSLHFGIQKINIHEYGNILSPHAKVPLPGTLDICFLSKKSISFWKKKLHANNIKIIDGPIERQGASGKLISIYCRDPDNNLIEISNLKNKND